MRSVLPALLLLGALAAGPACRRGVPSRLRLATTSAVRDSGLLGRLIPAFEAETGVRLVPLPGDVAEAVGHARAGTADLLLLDDPDAVAQLVQAGVAGDREEAWIGRLVVAGPAADPAGVRGLRQAKDVFLRLQRANAPFVSLGDQSGVHRAEQRFRVSAGLDPTPGPGVRRVAGGMLAALRAASEQQAYCLTDEAVFHLFRASLRLELLVESDEPEWSDSYTVVLLTPEKAPALNQDGARKFRDFLFSERGRALLRDFGRRETGGPLLDVP